MGCPVSNTELVLDELCAWLPGLDVSGLEEAGLKGLLVHVRSVQRCLDGLVARVHQRAERLAADCRCGSGDETVRGSGGSAVGARQARNESKRATTVDSVDGLGEALSSGEISGDHVDSVGRHLGKLTDEQRQSIDDDDVVGKAKSLPVDQFDRKMKRLADKARHDHGLADMKAKRAASEFRHWFDHKTGMGRFAGSVDPERYEALVNAVEQHGSRLAAAGQASGEPVTRDQHLAVEALVGLVTSSGGRDARNRLPSVTVVVDHDTIVHRAHDNSVAQTENGHDLAPETIARLCCDATIRRVTLDNTGVPINVGRKYRTAADAQWAAIKTVHNGCAWDGCTAPINFCQAHHIREWEHGGPTDLDNLIPLCSRHHHRVHEGQWHIKMLPDRSLETMKPNGAHHTTVPPPTRK